MDAAGRFVIQSREGVRVGEGVVFKDGEVVARLPADVCGVPLGRERSQWEDIETATSVINALNLRLEWVPTGRWEWEGQPEFWCEPEEAREEREAAERAERGRVAAAQKAERLAAQRREIEVQVEGMRRLRETEKRKLEECRQAAEPAEFERKAREQAETAARERRERWDREVAEGQAAEAELARAERVRRPESGDASELECSCCGQVLGMSDSGLCYYCAHADPF